tara:strand:- start:332 stop:592 length:261 start_codon:yes stop_codon:yes gene_type:complete
MALISYAIFRSQRKPKGHRDNNEIDRRMEIIKEIVTLDEQYENHNTDEAEYKKRRNELKQKAIATDEPSSLENPIITGEPSKDPEE